MHQANLASRHGLVLVLVEDHHAAFRPTRPRLEQECRNDIALQSVIFDSFADEPLNASTSPRSMQQKPGLQA